MPSRTSRSPQGTKGPRGPWEGEPCSSVAFLQNASFCLHSQSVLELRAEEARGHARSPCRSLLC